MEILVQSSWDARTWFDLLLVIAARGEAGALWAMLRLEKTIDKARTDVWLVPRLTCDKNLAEFQLTVASASPRGAVIERVEILAENTEGRRSTPRSTKRQIVVVAPFSIAVISVDKTDVFAARQEVALPDYSDPKVIAILKYTGQGTRPRERSHFSCE